MTYNQLINSQTSTECERCPYHYKTDDDRYPCCHYEGADGTAPCEQEVEY